MSDEIKNKIDDALLNFYLEASKEDIDDILTENIKNFEEYSQKKRKIIFLAKAVANKARNENLLELVNKFQEAISLNIEKPVAMLKGIIYGNSSFALYRNLDKLSKEDIIEIIKDKNLIELMEQLEENDKSH